MRLSGVLSEAWRNVRVGTTRALSWAVLMAVVVGGLAVVDVRAAVEVLQKGDDFLAAGAATWVLTAPGAVDAARCEALASLDDVVAAGALRPVAGTRLAALPSTEVPTYEVTTGLLEVVGARTTGIGVLLPEPLAASLGSSTGIPLTDGRHLTRGGSYRYPDDGRDTALGYALLAPTPSTGAFDACWVTIWPANPGARAALRYALLPTDPSDADQVTERQLNPRLGQSFDTRAALLARGTRHAPVVALVAGLVIGLVAMRTRRLELASARHAGVRVPALMLQTALETVAWSLSGLILALPAVLLAGRSLGIDAAAIWLLGGRTLLAGGCAAVLGAVLAAGTTRERHLFRYFRQR